MTFLNTCKILLFVALATTIFSTAQAKDKASKPAGKQVAKVVPLSPDFTASSTKPGAINPFSKENQGVAQAICVAKQESPGWVYAVPRMCNKQSQSCKSICGSLSGKDKLVNKLACFNSLHLYTNGPAKSPSGGKAPSQTGLKTYIYNSCSAGSCGPNYCCCGGK